MYLIQWKTNSSSKSHSLKYNLLMVAKCNIYQEIIMKSNHKLKITYIIKEIHRYSL